QRDPAYDQVLLHVVLNNTKQAYTSRGEPVLTLELAGRLKPRRHGGAADSQSKPVVVPAARPSMAGERELAVLASQPSAGAFGATSSLEDVAVRPRGTQPSPHASGAAGFFEDMSVGCQGSQPSPVASGAAGSREDMSIGCQGSQPSPVAS